MTYANRKAYVVFTGKTDIWFLKFLKQGFRHCFVLLKDKNHWISVDPLSSHTEIEIIPNNKNYSLLNWLEAQNFLVIEANFENMKGVKAPMSAMNCVESIKRILGIHNFMIMTPYQLFKYLKNNNKEKDNG